VERERFAALERFVERRGPRSGRRDLLLGHVGIDRPDFEAEPQRPLRYRAPDAAEADDRKSRPAEDVQRSRDGVIPRALADAPVQRDDSAEQREQERQRAVGHLLDAVVRHVADPDVACRRRLEIHVVVTDAAGRDDFERRKPCELLLTNREIGPGQEADDVVPFPGSGGSLHVDAAIEDLAHAVE
jgi:hypothetical protein